MIDYHVHPDFSPDAQGSVEEFCQRAMDLGLEEVCFTTHYEPDPARREVESIIVRGRKQRVDSDWPVAYLAAIQAASEKFPGLVVLAGVEIGYEPGLEPVISNFLNRYPFDFVLGSIHCLDHVAITNGDELDRFRREYLCHGAESVAERYIHHLRAAAGTRLFDSLGHFDVYRKYIAPLYPGNRFQAAVDRMLPEALDYVAAAGAGIEVNSSALRRGDREPYPSARILKQARDAGVRVYTIGSDAHRPRDLGTGLDAAVGALSALGLSPSRFRRRERQSWPA